MSDIFWILIAALVALALIGQCRNKDLCLRQCKGQIECVKICEGKK